MIGRARSATLTVALATSLVLLVVLPAAASRAPALSAPGTASTDDSTVAHWLQRASAAQSTLDYSGTQLVSTWMSGRAGSALLDVVHQAGVGLTTRPHGAGSGTMAADQGGTVTVPDEPTGTSYLAAAADRSMAPLSLLLSHYDVVVANSSQVAGRAVHELVVRRSAGIAARLWLDDATGLVLRREVYDPAGATVSAMAFLDVTVTSADAATTVRPDVQQPSAGSWSAPSTAELAAVRKAGWQCPGELAGGLVLYDVRAVPGPVTRADDAPSTIMHLSYSDGLNSLSVFQQRGRLDPSAAAGYDVAEVGGYRVRVRPGLQTHAVWQSGDMVVTTISDEAPDQLTQVLAAMPPVTDQDGWLAGAAAQLADAAGWLTPLR